LKTDLETGLIRIQSGQKIQKGKNGLKKKKKLRNFMFQELEILVGWLEASLGARESFILVKFKKFISFLTKK
jgi:hypothetical protein